jgi:effector-binding domain-containing protein
MKAQNEEKECCPVFDPQPWEEVTHEWNEKLFLIDSIPQFLHMPLPGTYGKAITRMWSYAEKNDALPENNDFLLLAYDPTPWKSIFYLTIKKEVPDKNKMERISGTFISKVFDGPYQDVPKYIKETEKYLASIGKKSKKYYFYYTTCPKCAKKYGHNYIVVFVEV